MLDWSAVSPRSTAPSRIMVFPAPFTVRHPTMADAPLVIELVNAAETADLGEPLLELTDIETDWASSAIDTDEDVIVVEEDGRLVAWAQVYRDRGDADVHPDARGRGLGTCLIEWMEERMMARTAAGQAAVLGQPIPDTDTAAAALLRARGYEPRWSSWVLRLPPDARVIAPDLPPGIEIRPYRAEEERAVHRVIDDAFSEWEGRRSVSFDDWRDGVTARPDFDPSLLLVAATADSVVGACVGIHYPGEGWVDQIAVARPHRGQGLAKAMLAAAFSEFRRRGEHRMGLSTDSRTGALDLYLGIGMVVEQDFTNYAKVLREPC